MTPLGVGAWPTYRALLSGRTLCDRIEALPTGLQPAQWVAALGGVSVAKHTATDPAAELAERAAREAAEMAGLTTHKLPLDLGTSKGAVARLSRTLGAGRPLSEQDHLALALGPHAYLAHELSRRLGTLTRGHTVAACASGLAALDRAWRRLAYTPHTPADAVALVVTADAALTPAFVHSYQRLGVLADTTPTGYRQRPLDQRRQGFMLSEMGAAVLLRRLPPGRAPQPGEIELVRTATACEAFDMVRPSDTMPALGYVARQLFTAAQARNQAVDVLHPHAPGTADHDPQELRVLLQTRQAACGPSSISPHVYANKGALGHALGASGLVSLVTACLALRTGKLPPMPWLDRPIAMPDANPTRTRAVRCDCAGTHAVFAAGFGGHTAGALLQRAPADATSAP